MYIVQNTVYALEHGMPVQFEIESRLRREISEVCPLMRLRGRFVYMFLSEIDQRQNKCKCSEHMLETRSRVRLYRGCVGSIDPLGWNTVQKWMLMYMQKMCFGRT